jgi:hypothetical protein
MTRLSPAARTAIFDLLDDGEDLADASTYADEHKREIQGSAPWHYVNVPLDKDAYDDSFCDPRKGCVVGKIKEFRDVLKDPNASDADKKMALRFVVHLIGDVHQPLHVADHEDEGGNHVQLQFFRRHTNFHRIWDSEIIAHAQIGNAVGFRDIEEIASGQSVDEGAWVRELSLLAKGRADDWLSVKDAAGWATESLKRAKDAYINPRTGRLIEDGDRLGQDYQDKNLPVVKERLAQAGMRLLGQRPRYQEGPPEGAGSVR